MSEGGLVLQGQQFNPSDFFVRPFSQQEVTGLDNIAALIGQQYTEIIPTDGNAAKVTIFDIASINAQLDAVAIAYQVMTDIQLPDVLTAVTITTNAAAGVGAVSYPDTQQQFYFHGSGSGSVHPTGSAHGSASIMYDAQPIVKRRRATKYPAVRWFFYMPETATRANILTRLTALAGATVLDLPVFHEEEVVLTLKGASLSISAEASSTVSVSDSPNNYSGSYEYGGGSSKDVSISQKTVVIPPTLHGAITLSPTSSTQAVTVAAEASTLAVVTTNITVTPISNAQAVTASATATVSPTSISATTPANIPTSGLYLVNLDSRSADFDRTMVFAEIVDFSIFA